MDDNTSIQFRLRLAQINGVQLTNKNSVNEGATEAQRLAGAWKRSTEPSDKIKITGVQKIPGGTKVAGSGKASIHKDAKITGVQKIPGEMKEEQLSETNHLDHITQALNGGNTQVRRNAISHRLATPEHITQALKDKESYVRAAAINHHSATPEHITQALKDKEGAVRLLAIKHPKATSEHITQALKDKNEGVRLAALKHHNVTSEHITQALKDKSSAVRYDAITHRVATTAHLKRGMKDSDESIRRAADIIHKRDHDPITDAARPRNLRADSD